MNKFVSSLPVLLFLLLAGCGSQPKMKQYHLSGDAKGLKSDKLLLYTIDEKGKVHVVDTLHVKEGKIDYSFAPFSPEFFMISNGSASVPAILGDADVTLTVDTIDFKHSYVTGSSSNDLLHRFYAKKDSVLTRRKEIFKKLSASQGEERKKWEKALMKTDEEWTGFVFDFARENMSLPGVLALIELTYQPSPDFKKITDIYGSYPENLKKTKAGKFLTYRLNTLSVGAVGTQAPNFTGLTPDGEPISLFGSMGKVTIVDFWASWCKPCRVNNPFLVRLYEKYHDQGLNIISVSLDKSKEAWVRAIQQDGLNWFHVSNLKGWQEPIAKQYHINFIPQTLLLDSKGIIRAKNLHGKSLEDAIKKWLSE